MFHFNISSFPVFFHRLNNFSSHFSQPFDTRDINVYNKTQCKQAYKTIQARVQSGIEYLLNYRKSDPFSQFIPRVLYESITGKIAPTATPL